MLEKSVNLVFFFEKIAFYCLKWPKKWPTWVKILMRVYIALKWPVLHFLFSSTFTQMALSETAYTDVSLVCVNIQMYSWYESTDVSLVCVYIQMYPWVTLSGHIHHPDIAPQGSETSASQTQTQSQVQI